MSTIAKPWQVISTDDLRQIRTTYFFTHKEAALHINRTIKSIIDECGEEGEEYDFENIDPTDTDSREAYLEDPPGSEHMWIVWRIVNIEEEQ